MKRFIFSILCVSTFFVGVGGLINQVGARFKSDERALALIRQARIAVGGDANISAVRSLTAKGKAVHTFNLDGADKTQAGDFEINLALPNQFSRMIKLGVEDKTASGAKQTINEESRVVIVKKGDGERAVFNSGEGAPKRKVVIMKDDDGKFETENVGADAGAIRKEMRVVHGGEGEARGNEFLRTMLSLFLTAPEGFDVDYFYAGAGDVDGAACEIVEAKTGDASVAKIYLSKSTNLPVMMTYQGMDMPRIVKINRDDAKSNADKKDVKVFVREAEMPMTAEISVKFSDYRTVNGLQLPFTWTQTANGKAGASISIESYEINPANIADKFNQMPERTMIKTRQPQ